MFTNRVKLLLGLLLYVTIGSVLYAQTVTKTTSSLGSRYVTRVTGVLNTTGYNLDCGGTTTCPAGTYLLNYDMGMSAPVTAGSVAVAITAHDGLSSRTTTSSSIDGAVGTVTGTHPTSGAGSTGGAIVITTAGTGHVTAAITVTSGSGTSTGTMYFNASLQRLR